MLIIPDSHLVQFFTSIFLLLGLCADATNIKIDRSTALDGGVSPMSPFPEDAMDLMQRFPHLHQHILHLAIKNPIDRAAISMASKELQHVMRMMPGQPLPNAGWRIAMDIVHHVLGGTEKARAGERRSMLLLRSLLDAERIFTTEKPHRLLLPLDTCPDYFLVLFAGVLFDLAHGKLTVPLERCAQLLSLIRIAPQYIVPLLLLNVISRKNTQGHSKQILLLIG